MSEGVVSNAEAYSKTMGSLADMLRMVSPDDADLADRLEQLPMEEALPMLATYGSVVEEEIEALDFKELHLHVVALAPEEYAAVVTRVSVGLTQHGGQKMFCSMLRFLYRLANKLKA